MNASDGDMPEEPFTANMVPGNVDGSVVQASVIHGDIHLHSLPAMRVSEESYSQESSGQGMSDSRPFSSTAQRKRLIADSVPEQLPLPTPHYVNNVAILSQATQKIAERIPDQHIPTMVFGGPPGIGKTTTALMVADLVKDRFPDGRLFARLSDVNSNPEIDVLQDFLLALGDDRERIPTRLDARRSRYLALTKGKQLQVFLDGVVSARQVKALSPAGSDSLVLVTEARSLNSLAADSSVTFFDLRPLELPAAKKLLIRMVGEERVAAESDAVEEIIRFCDYLPIALCIVGSILMRFPLKSVNSLTAKLRNKHRRLSTLSNSEDFSVTSVFDAAYDSISSTAQACYRALGLKPRSSEISARALASALELSENEVFDAMSELVDSRLVEELDGDRYLVRELVQLHAEQLAEATGENSSEKSRRLVDFYLHSAFAADAFVSPQRPWRKSLLGDLSLSVEASGIAFSDAQSARRWLQFERLNLRAALQYSYDAGEHKIVCQACVVLWPFYEQEKYLEELIDTHQWGVSSAQELENHEFRSLILTQLAFGYNLNRAAETATATFAQAVSAAEEANDEALLATALEGLGLAYFTHAQDDTREALVQLRRNLELTKKIGNPRRVALSSYHLAKAEEPAAALPLLAHALDFFKSSDSSEAVNQAKVLTWQGKKLIILERYSESEAALREAFTVLSGQDRSFDSAEVQVALGDLSSAIGKKQEALERYGQAIALYESLSLSSRSEEIRERIERMNSVSAS